MIGWRATKERLVRTLPSINVDQLTRHQIYHLPGMVRSTCPTLGSVECFLSLAYLFLNNHSSWCIYGSVFSYVPIKVDYSEYVPSPTILGSPCLSVFVGFVFFISLYDIMVFFVGDPKKGGGQDHLAEKIASAGKAWAGQHWRRVDMVYLCLYVNS